MSKILVMIILIIAACSEKENVESMIYDQRSFEDSVCIENECANVILDYPFFTNDNMTASIINEYIDQQLVMMLSYTDSDSSQSLQFAVQEFLNSFSEYAQEGSFVQSWEIEVIAAATFQNNKLLSISFDAYSYTGGAHPNSFRQYVNINKEEGFLIKNNELIQDQEGLLQIAENAFREYHEVREGVSLEEDGRFFLKNDSDFFLPVAIGLEHDDLVLYYNPYEIASYAQGPTMLRFPIEEVGYLLNDSLYDQ